MYHFTEQNTHLKYVIKPFVERLDMYKKLIEKHKRVVIIVPKKENIWLYKSIFSMYNVLEYHSSITGIKRLNLLSTIQNSTHYVLISTLIGMYIPLPNDVIMIVDDADSAAYNDSHSPFLDARTTFHTFSTTLLRRTVIASTMPLSPHSDIQNSLFHHTHILQYPHYYSIKPPYQLSETIQTLFQNNRKQLKNWFITMPHNDDTAPFITHYNIKIYDMITSPDALQKPPKAIMCILSGTTIQHYTRVIELTERAMYHTIPIYIVHHYSENTSLIDSFIAEINDCQELLEAPYGIFCTIHIPKKKREYYTKQLSLALLDYKNIVIYREYESDTDAVIMLKSSNEEMLYNLRMQFYDDTKMLWKR